MKFKSHSLKLTGLEGVFALMFVAIPLVVLALIPCDDNGTVVCSKGTFVNTIESLKIVFSTPLILTYYLLQMVAGMGYKASSIYLIKCSTATNRMTVDASRTVLIWAFFLAYPARFHEHEVFDFVQLLGFIVQVFGTLVFNEVVVLPFWGLNENLTLKQNKRYDRLVDDEPAEVSHDTIDIIKTYDSEKTKLLLSGTSQISRNPGN